MKPTPASAPFDSALAKAWMTEALAEADRAFERDEVPVGCIVIAPDGRVTGRGGDDRQHGADPLAHAEVAAIRQAAAAQGDWRLDGHTLVVTLEPCPMCAGLILMSRVSRVIFGAPNDKWGAAGTKIHLLDGGVFPHKPEVVAGVMTAPCAEILSRYFARRRKSP